MSWVRADDPGEPSTGNPRLSVTDAEATLLGIWTAGMTVLEIGTGLGVSTRAMAATAVTVHTVDIDPWVWETIWPYLPENVVTHESVDTVPEVDVAFIDGDHTTLAVARDLSVALAKASRLIIAHDTHTGEVRNGLGAGFEFVDTVHGLGLRRLG